MERRAGGPKLTFSLCSGRQLPVRHGDSADSVMMGGKYTKELPAELEPGMSASKEMHEEVRVLMLSRGSCFHACTHDAIRL